MVEFDLEIKFGYPNADPISKIVIEGGRFIDDDEKSSEGEAAQEAAMGISARDVYEEIDGVKYVIR